MKPAIALSLSPISTGKGTLTYKPRSDAFAECLASEPIHRKLMVPALHSKVCYICYFAGATNYIDSNKRSAMSAVFFALGSKYSIFSSKTK